MESGGEDSALVPILLKDPTAASSTLVCQNLEGLLSPLGTSGRVHYTCMDVGAEHIVFGANTGSLYFFNRAALRFLQLVSSPEIRAAVTHIRFSPDERFVALSTLDGELIVLEPKLGTRAKERIVLRHHLHRDSATAAASSATTAPPSATSSSPPPPPSTLASASATIAAALGAAGAATTTTAGGDGHGVTCLTWAPRGQDDENYLFSSDTTGAIMITPVITSLIKRSLLLASTGPEPLYKADSRVVQLDCTSVAASTTAAMKLQLLISTLTKSILLTIDTNAKQITGLQVGSKPRKGNYGACFSAAASSAETAASRSPTVLCAARPGRRIWLADAMTATVRKTLNFSTSLELLPAFPTSPATNLTPRPKLVTFGKLTTFGDGDYLLSWDDERTKAQHALCLIDVQKVEIRAWTCFAAIRDLCVLQQEDSVYVLHEANEPKGSVRTLLSKISIPLSHTTAPTTAPAAAAAVDNNATAAQAADATVTPAAAVDTQPEPTKDQAAAPVEVTPSAVTETVPVANGNEAAETAQQLEPTSAAVEAAAAAQPTSPAVDQKADDDHTPSEQAAAGQEANMSPAAETQEVTPAATSLEPASEPAANAQQPTTEAQIEPQIVHVEEQKVSTSVEDAPPDVPPVRAVSDDAEGSAAAEVAAAESPASDVSDGGDVAAAVTVRRVRTTEDNLVVPRPRKKGPKRRTARIEEAATKSPTKSPGSAAAALPPLAQVRPAASTLREILSSSSSGVALPGAPNAPTITAPSAPVLSLSAPASPTLSASSTATALPPTSLPASPLPVPATSSSPSAAPLAFVTPESLADVASPLPPLSSSPSSASALETPAADSSLAGRALEPTVAPTVASAADQPSSAPAAAEQSPAAGGEAAASAGVPASGTSDQASAAAGSPTTERKDAAANSLMSTKKWKEEIQNVGRRAMQLSKTPVNLDEIFQKPALNFFKKSTGDKEGESTHDEAPTTTGTPAASSASTAAAAEKEKTKKEKEEKEKKEKQQKEDKAKKDKAETEGSNKEAKSAAGLFKRAANTLLESTSKPGTISSSDVAGLFTKAKSLVSITKFAAGHDANGAAAGPALAPGDEADDPQKAFWQLSKSLFEVLASSLPASTKFTTETLENMKEWVEEWSSLAASPEGLPPTWVTEILTACFEQHVLPTSLASSLPNEFAVDKSENENEDQSEDESEGEDDEERAWKLRERDLMAFLDRYFALLDHDRVLFFCNAHRLSLCISFFLHTEQILLHQTAALTPATAATAAAQYLVQLWQALENLLQPQLGSPDAEREGAAVEEALTVLRKADNNLSLVLRFLPALFAKSPRVTAQYAASLYPFVRSWNVRDALPPSPVVTLASASAATSSSSAALLPPFSASTHIRKAHHQRHDSDSGAGVRPFVSAISYDERWAVYADYLERLVERHDECRRDPRVVHELFECALQQGVEVASQEFGLAYRDADVSGDERASHHQVWRRGLFFDDEGRPRVGPRDLRWKRDVLRPILCDGAQRKYAHRPRRLLYLAKRYGHFEAVKELALRVDDVPTALEAGVFTDDWDCVSRLAQRHGDPWFWQHLLAFAAALWRREGRLPSSAQQESKSKSEATKKTKASASGAKNESDGKAQRKKGILLEDVVAHMIKALGPIPAFEMIAASGSDDVAELATVFPPVAYRHFVHAVNVDIQHKELVYWMLKRVLEDLWLDKHTKRPPTIAPQFRAVKDAEVAAQLDALPFLHRLGTAAPSALGPREKAAPAAAATSTPNEKKYNIGFDYTTPTPHFFEEMTGHWGLRQQLVSGSCECCTLPLAESVGRSSSLVVFECGHAFHEFCVAEDACPVCLTSHMPSLSSFLFAP